MSLQPTSQDIEQLCKLTEQLVRQFGISDKALREERILSTYGNLNYDRPEVTLDEVRRVFDQEAGNNELCQVKEHGHE